MIDTPKIHVLPPANKLMIFFINLLTQNVNPRLKRFSFVIFALNLQVKGVIDSTSESCNGYPYPWVPNTHPYIWVGNGWVMGMGLDAWVDNGWVRGTRALQQLS
jgi:hypothetical protein